MGLIGVRFCGNCNREIDFSKLYNLLQELLVRRFQRIKLGKVNILIPKEYDLTLLVNGCKAGCLVPGEEGASLLINGLSFQGRRYEDEEQLARAVVEKLDSIREADLK